MRLRRNRSEVVSHEPHVVMHEDDPVLNKYPTIFNRRNISFAKGVSLAVTIGLVVFQQFQIQDDQDAFAKYLQERKAIVQQGQAEIACFIVRNHPDSDGQDYADLRKKYACPKYDIKKIRPVSPRASTPATSSTSRGRSSSTPGAIGPASVSVPSGSRSVATAPRRPVATRTVVGPTRTRPVATHTVTRTPAPAVPPTSRALLCSPLGLPLGLGC